MLILYHDGTMTRWLIFEFLRAFAPSWFKKSRLQGSEARISTEPNNLSSKSAFIRGHFPSSSPCLRVSVMNSPRTATERAHMSSPFASHSHNTRAPFARHSPHI